MKHIILLLAAIFTLNTGAMFAQNDKLEKVLDLRKETGDLEGRYRLAASDALMQQTEDKAREALSLLDQVIASDKKNENYARMSKANFLQLALNSIYRRKQYDKLLSLATTNLPAMQAPANVKAKESYNGDVVTRESYAINYYRNYYLAAMAAALPGGHQDELLKYSAIALEPRSALEPADAMHLHRELFSYYYKKDNYDSAMAQYDRMTELMTTNIFVRNDDGLKRQLLAIDTLVSRTGGISYEQHDKEGRTLERVARFYGEINEYQTAYDKADLSIRNGRINYNLLDFRLEMALKLNDQTKINHAADEIIAHKGDFKLTTYDYDRLALSYEKAGEAEKARKLRESGKSLKEGKNKKVVTQINYFAGVYPVHYFFHVYPISFAVGTSKLSHEFRFTLYDQDNGYTFPLKNNNRDEIKYDGWQLAYVLRKRIGSLPLYIGAQGNYTSLKYNTTTVTLQDKSTGDLNTGQQISPMTTEYGPAIILGANFKVFWRLYLDAYIGYGYNFTNFSPGFNTEALRTQNTYIQNRVDRLGYWRPYSGFRIWMSLN